jgi:lysophospholipase L1-like esterase
MNTRLFCALFLGLQCCVGLAAESQSTRIVLVGDSTMASETGYGDALCKRFVPTVTCLNMAKGGRSSGSYRAEGSWAEVLTVLKKSTPNQLTYVLIQFGHNDQPGKPGRSTDLRTEFPVNIKNYVLDVRAAGAIPVLVTPLTRREFKAGVLQNNLQDWANATRTVAENGRVPVLELNADSFAAVQKMGQDEADTLAMAPASAPASTIKGEHYRGFDRTHLGAKGAALFSAMVANELLEKFPQLKSEFQSQPDIEAVNNP